MNDPTHCFEWIAGIPAILTYVALARGLFLHLRKSDHATSESPSGPPPKALNRVMRTTLFS
jgi:hypothetical protein